MGMHISIASLKALYPFSCVVQSGFVSLFYNLEFGIGRGYLCYREMSQYGLGFLSYILLLLFSGHEYSLLNEYYACMPLSAG